MPWVARALWAAVSVALAVLLLWAAIAMPDRVPMKLDAAGYRRVHVELAHGGGLADAINDRLRRAAAKG